MTTRGPTVAWYGAYADPTFDIAARVDCDDLIARCRHAGHAPFGVVLHAIGEAVQAIAPFRRRLRRASPNDDWRVHEHAIAHPGFVVLNADDEVRFCGLPWNADRDLFLAELAAAATAAAGPLVAAHADDDCFFATCMPWIEVSSVRHARHGDARVDGPPRFAWGKIDAQGFTLCVSAHHALVDGLHVAQLVRRVSATLS